jgi:hypothetical protein
MTSAAELALTASLSEPAKLDEWERAVADEFKKLEPGCRSPVDIDELMNIVQLLELRLSRPGALLGKLNADVKLQRGPIEQALEQIKEAHVLALHQAGLGTRVVDILKSWMTATIQGRDIERMVHVLRWRNAEGTASPAVTERREDPVTPLSATELGERLGVGDESVRLRERAGKLFSILRPGRKRGREYPAFQGWPEIAGEPLERALAALTPAHLAAAYGFFTAPTDLLGGLSPIEVMLGSALSERTLDADAERLLKATREERLIAVEKTAASVAAQLSA